MECEKCGGKTTHHGTAEPLAEELKFGGNRVELHQCINSPCSYINRFPRYNSPQKLLITRRGRCGEWANVI